MALVAVGDIDRSVTDWPKHGLTGVYNKQTFLGKRMPEPGYCQDRG
jgi:hypothetical protein